MKKVLVYTFKNFPYKRNLPFKDTRVFNCLNNDIEDFCQEILEYKPKLILGIAKSTNTYSTIERYTVNVFHKDKKVLHNGVKKYELNVPSNFQKYFTVRNRPTESFCNLTMFKIKHFLEENNIKIPFVFIHITEEGAKNLTNII